MKDILKYSKQRIVIVLAAAVVLVSMLSSGQVFADVVDPFDKSCSAVAQNSSICKATGGAGLFGANSIWGRIIQSIIYVIGAVSVIMIVVGGMRYVLSQGEQAQIAAAKNTILYAIVGIVVAISAQALVSFVLTRLF